jgi:hypothetical protein
MDFDRNLMDFRDYQDCELVSNSASFSKSVLNFSQYQDNPRNPDYKSNKSWNPERKPKKSQKSIKFRSKH